MIIVFLSKRTFYKVEWIWILRKSEEKSLWFLGQFHPHRWPSSDLPRNSSGFWGSLSSYRRPESTGFIWDKTRDLQLPPNFHQHLFCKEPGHPSLWSWGKEEITVTHFNGKFTLVSSWYLSQIWSYSVGVNGTAIGFLHNMEKDWNLGLIRSIKYS